MNIPYYYNSGYGDDGVNVYTCLQCGDSIHVRGIYHPYYCSYCGVKYEGEKGNIGQSNKCWYSVCFTEKYYWSIEEKTVELWGQPLIEEEPWREKSYYRLEYNQTPRKILEEKRKYEKQDEVERENQIKENHRIKHLRKEKDPNFDDTKVRNEKAFTSKKEYRIVRKKEIKRYSCMIRKDIYLKKTGKEFNEYNDRLPYGVKEEITTGIKFLP